MKSIAQLGRLVTSGWGLLLLLLAWLSHLMVNTASYRLLFTPGEMPRFLVALRTLWVGGAVNTLLPVASVGGEVVKGRLITLDGVHSAHVSASVTIDLTDQALSLLLWPLVDIAVLIVLEADRSLAMTALAGSALLGLGIAGFWRVQRGGAIDLLARLTPNSSLVESAAAVDQAIRDLYARPGRIILATLIRLMGRVLLAGKLWLAAWLMGFPVDLLEALMLKSLIGALRGAAFPVPGGLGDQEGGYVVLGGLMGYPHNIMLGLSLATRVRELLVSLPGLLAWQHVEGRALWQQNTLQKTLQVKPAEPLTGMSQNVAFKPLAISCALIIRIERRVHMDREPAAVIANRKHRQQRSTGGTGPSPGVADNINFAMEKTDRLTVLLGPANTDRDYMIVLKVAVQSLHGDCRALRIEHYPRAEILILGNGFTRLSQTIPNRGDENPWRG